MPICVDQLKPVNGWIMIAEQQLSEPFLANLGHRAREIVWIWSMQLNLLRSPTFLISWASFKLLHMLVRATSWTAYTLHIIGWSRGSLRRWTLFPFLFRRIVREVFHWSSTRFFCRSDVMYIASGAWRWCSPPLWRSAVSTEILPGTGVVLGFMLPIEARISAVMIVSGFVLVGIIGSRTGVVDRKRFA